jgi:hypothetical protein
VVARGCILTFVAGVCDVGIRISDQMVVQH